MVLCLIFKSLRHFDFLFKSLRHFDFLCMLEGSDLTLLIYMWLSGFPTTTC